MFTSSAWRRLCASAVFVLAACGGGGGGDPGSGDPGAGATRQPPPATSIDNLVTGATLGGSAADYVPIGRPGRWVYERSQPGGTSLGTSEIVSTPGSGALSTVRETVDGDPDDTVYRWTSRGWELDAGVALDLPPSAAAIVGSVLAYPKQFPADSTASVQIRRGSFGQDLDGDGVHDGFELVYRQSVMGMETVDGPTGPLRALKVMSSVTLTLMPSDFQRYADYVQTFEITEWLVAGVGPVRMQRRVSDTAGGGEGPIDWRLVSVTLDGSDPLRGPGFTQATTIELSHLDLVFDRVRRVYYASVAATDGTRGNRIATIDADTGRIGLSAPVGSNPGALAIAADGASLYVAVNGSGELVRLALPGMGELSRTRLPTSPVYGQLGAQNLAASPTEPGTVAIALSRANVSPVHGGVALWRDGVLLPRQTQEHTGSNLIVFGADGRSVFGFNNESTEFGLRRLDVVDDGLVEGAVVPGAAFTFYLHTLDRDGDRLVFGGQVYGTDLAPRGSLPGSTQCRAAGGDRVVCLSSSTLDPTSAELRIGDLGSYTVVATLPIAPATAYASRLLVAGPPGQVALRDGIGHPAWREAPRIVLLRNSALP